MTELVFVDTNVLVYQIRRRQAKRQKAADAWSHGSGRSAAGD